MIHIGKEETIAPVGNNQGQEGDLKQDECQTPKQNKKHDLVLTRHDMDDKITPQISKDYSQSEHFGIQLHPVATSRTHH